MVSLALLLVISGSGSAAAWERPWLRGNTPIEDFVDQGFARSLWTGVKSRAEIEALETRYCASPAVAEMEKKLRRPQPQKKWVEYARANGGVGSDLGKCIDIRATWYSFSYAYSEMMFAANREKRRPSGWPLMTDRFCNQKAKETVLAASCSDFPDWRSDEKRAFDTKRGGLTQAEWEATWEKPSK